MRSLIILCYFLLFGYINAENLKYNIVSAFFDEVHRNYEIVHNNDAGQTNRSDEYFENNKQLLYGLDLLSDLRQNDTLYLWLDLDLYYPNITLWRPDVTTTIYGMGEEKLVTVNQNYTSKSVWRALQIFDEDLFDCINKDYLRAAREASILIELDYGYTLLTRIIVDGDQIECQSVQTLKFFNNKNPSAIDSLIKIYKTPGPRIPIQKLPENPTHSENTKSLSSDKRTHKKPTKIFPYLRRLYDFIYALCND